MVLKKSSTIIKNFLNGHQETIAVAESVTSGYLQLLLSQMDDATNFYQGGITAYNLGQKTRHLHVDPIYAQRCDCVSEKTALDMAINASRLFSSDWGIGITGYAAPVPALKVRSLYAFYAFAHRGNAFMGRVECKPIALEKAQRFFAVTVLSDLATHLTQDL